MMAFNCPLTLFRLQNARLLSACTAYPTITHYYKLAYSTKPSQTQKSIYKTKEAKQFRFYILEKYNSYLGTYQAMLEKKFPLTMQLYRVFVEGVKSFYSDFKLFIGLVRALHGSGKSLHDLTLHEIELYEQMPKDMRRVAPVLILSPLPFAYYIILPLIYYFPRHLLSRHFWNLQQRSEFSVIFLQQRLKHNKPIFRYLQLQLPKLRGNEVHKLWSNVLGQLGSGVQPSIQEILGCKCLFEDEPYHLMYLSGNHAWHLLKLHDLHMGWFRRTRLADKALILQAMDLAIIREGGLRNLNHESLRNACLLRGLNPTNMKYEDMIDWLNCWIEISQHVDKDCFSLLLHCPILLGYNQPSNWQLIYGS